MRRLTSRERILAAAAVIAAAAILGESWRAMQEDARALRSLEVELASQRGMLVRARRDGIATGSGSLSMDEAAQTATDLGAQLSRDGARFALFWRGEGAAVWRTMAALSPARDAVMRSLVITRVGRELEVSIVMEETDAP